MKTDRLIAITMYLLNRKIVSAAKLAERFEVSKRTIQRDMETLNQAGIPIVSSYGADGGYEIMDGFQLTKQIAGVDDYLNIITALKGFCSAYDNNKINETLDKALTIMQPGEQRIFIDFTAAREDLSINESIRILEKTIHEKRPVLIEYTNALGTFSERFVEPIALSYQWYAWYLFAYCTVKQDYRLFKLSRVTSCKPGNGHFSKEHENAETLMQKKNTSDKRTYYHICLLCKSEVRQAVLEYFNCKVIAEHENGDFTIEMNLPFERMWFSLLLGFGNQVTVLEPEELRMMLKQKAQEIISVYE